MQIYTIPVDSFREQFGNMASMELKVVKVQSPRGMIQTYKTFPIKKVRCINDSSLPVTLNIKPSFEMRITDNRGKRTIFYLDRICVENDIITGHQSRKLGFIQKTIALSDISKIEIQDGKKYYRYL
jgi:hypothetical protein